MTVLLPILPHQLPRLKPTMLGLLHHLQFLVPGAVLAPTRENYFENLIHNDGENIPASSQQGVASEPNRVQRLSRREKIDLEDLDIDKYLGMNSNPQ